MEYKVLKINLAKKSSRRFFGIPGLFMNPVSTEEMEALLNKHAQEGWKVISCMPVNSNLMGISGGELLTVILEREPDGMGMKQNGYATSFQ